MPYPPIPAPDMSPAVPAARVVTPVPLATAELARVDLFAAAQGLSREAALARLVCDGLAANDQP